MNNVEIKNAPLLEGWVIGAAAGLVAAAVSMIVMGFNLPQAGLVAALLLVVVGVILGLPRGAVIEAAGDGATETVDDRPVGATARLSAMTGSQVSSLASAPVTAAPVTAAPVSVAPVSAEPETRSVSFLAPVMPDATASASSAAAAASFPAGYPVGRRPEALAAARSGLPDDLKQIKGVGPVLEKLLHSLGFFHFDQVAAWTAEEVAWVDENLEGFKGRVTRDEWVPQAKILAAGGTTEHATRVANGEIPG